MTCSAGHNQWVSTSNAACFVTRKGIFQSCFCPISTCVADSEGYYSCEFTYLSYFIIYLLVAVLMAACVAYYMYSRRIAAAHEKRVVPIVDWKAYNDRMFGVYHTAGDEGDHTSSGNGTNPNSNPNTARGDTKEMATIPAGGGAINTSDSEGRGLLGAGTGASYGGTGVKKW